MDYVDINNYSVSFFYRTLQRFMQLVASLKIQFIALFMEKNNEIIRTYTLKYHDVVQ
jgi:hypothetical protein